MATWQPSLAIGIPLIDMQHKQLLDQMDSLLDAINAHHDSKQVGMLMGFLDMYVNNHFSYEEQCMHLKQCPVAGQNKAAHEYFQQRLTLIRDTLKQQQASQALAKKTLEELRSWFVAHIKGIDVHLGAWK